MNWINNVDIKIFTQIRLRRMTMRFNRFVLVHVYKCQSLGFFFLIKISVNRIKQIQCVYVNK